MRGAPGSSSSKAWALRIIPADAGSTPPASGPHGQAQDHPRGCGEHGRHFAGRHPRGGSSPRMRGALVSCLNYAVKDGIIPADAGSTAMNLKENVDIWDHPRGCGEHILDRQILISHSGSSPRMRGALGYDPGVGAGPRIIPADAGSTSPGSHCVRHLKDHPRGCGEHCCASALMAWDDPSSPRMRGALVAGRQSRIGCRIIPADAGSTSGLAMPSFFLEDHPRGCGEHVGVAAVKAFADGSSPRMRGAQ